MTRRPGYDIYGQPTKMDPRDFPDPLRPSEPEPPKADRRGDWGCSVFAVAVLLAVVVAGCSVAGPGTRTAGDVSPGRSVGRGGSDDPAIHQPARPLAGRRTGGAMVSHPAPPPQQAGAPAAVSGYSGIVNYADPRHGRYYLAIPDGRGVRVEICGPGGCLIRTSTDAGPDLAMQRAGRIADLNSVDWQRISGVPLRFGGFQGTILILKRPARIELPQTSTKEGP